MKNLIVTLVFCLLTGFLNAQLRWERIYNNDSTYSYPGPGGGYNPHAHYQLNDGGYWVMADSMNGHTKLLRLNAQGKLLRSVSVQGYPLAPSVFSDGSFIDQNGTFNPSGPDTCYCYAEKTDTTGQLVWSTCLMKYDSIHNYRANFTVERADGSLLVFGNKYQQYPLSQVHANHTDTSNFIICLEANGTIRWKRYYAMPFEDGNIQTAALMPNHDLMIGGYMDTSATVYSTTYYTARIDTNGQIKWLKYRGDIGISSIQRLPDNNYIVGGRYYLPGQSDVLLLKMDSNGNTIWQKNYGGSRFDVLREVIVTKDSQLTVLAITNSYGTGPTYADLWLYKTDGDGNMLWQNIFNARYDFSGTSCICLVASCIETSDHGFLIKTDKGFLNSHGQQTRGLWLIKTDGKGVVYPNMLQGTVFSDRDSNCVYNLPAEETIAWNMLHIGGGAYDEYTVSNDSGKYLLALDTGQYQIRAIPRSLYHEPCLNPYPVFIVDTITTTQLDIAMEINAYCPLMEASIAGTRMRVGREAGYTVQYCNTGTETAVQARAIVTLPWLFNYTAGADSFSSVTNECFFNVGDVLPFECRKVFILGVIDSAVAVGTVIEASVILEPDTVCINGYALHPARDTAHNPVFNSFDPNEKTAWPLPVDDNGHGGRIDTNTSIGYTIYFQNLGNDTAYDITVVDTLPEFLNIETFKPGASSHLYQLSVEGKHVIQFRFNNINLPAKVQNEFASQGFVKFTVTLNQGLAIATEIDNSAAIYFDINTAVVTNVAKHIIGKEILSRVEVTDNSNLLVYPNPANTRLYIKWMIENAGAADITVANTMGQVLAHLNPDAGLKQAAIEVGDYNDGIYFISVLLPNGVRICRRVMILH